MIKKILLAMFLAIASVSMLSAVSLDEIIDGAKASSPSYQNILLSYENNLINVKNLESDDKLGISVSAEINPLYKKTTTSSSYSVGMVGGNYQLIPNVEVTEEDGFTASSDISLVLPNSGNTTITGKVDVTTLYDDSSTDSNVSLGASHTFDFTGYSSSDSSDLEYASMKYSTELSRKTSELTFEKTVIATVSSLLTQEKSLLDAENTLAKQRKTVERIESLGTYSEDAPVYVNTKNILSQLESSYKAAEDQFQTAKDSYKTLTGLEWTGLDDVDEPVLDLKYYENGNTSVLLKSLSAESAELSYDNLYAQENPNALKIEGSTSGKIGDQTVFTLSGGASYNSKNWVAGANVTGTLGDQKSMNLTGSITYKDDNWSVTASPGVTVNSSKTTPTLTIKGTWNNGGKEAPSNDLSSALSGTSTSSKDYDDVLKKAQNSAIVAQNEYTDALSSYMEEAQSYSLRIISWESSRTQSESNLSYAKMMLENEKTMFELGLSTESNLRDAEIEAQKAEYDWKTMMLNGLSLERDLAIFAL